MSWWNNEPDIGVRTTPKEIDAAVPAWRNAYGGPKVDEWEKKTGGAFSPHALADIDTVVRSRVAGEGGPAFSDWHSAGGMPSEKWDAMAPMIANLVTRSLRAKFQNQDAVKLAMRNLILRRHWFGRDEEAISAWLDAWMSRESQPGGWFEDSGLPKTRPTTGIR